MLFNGLQEAYERTVAAGGAFRNIMPTAWELATACLRPGLVPQPIHRLQCPSSSPTFLQLHRPP